MDHDDEVARFCDNSKTFRSISFNEYTNDTLVPSPVFNMLTLVDLLEDGSLSSTSSSLARPRSLVAHSCENNTFRSISFGKNTNDNDTPISPPPAFNKLTLDNYILLEDGSLSSTSSSSLARPTPRSLLANFCENSNTFRSISFGENTNDILVSPPNAFNKLTLEDLLGSPSSSSSLVTTRSTRSLAKRRKQCNSVESFSPSSNSCSSSSYSNDDYGFDLDSEKHEGLTLQILLQDSHAPPYMSAFKGQVQPLTRNKVKALRRQGGEQIIKPSKETQGFLFPRFGSIKVSRENITRTINGKEEVIKNWEVYKNDKSIDDIVGSSIDEITKYNKNNKKVENKVKINEVQVATDSEKSTKITICTEKKARKDEDLRQYIIKNIGSDKILKDVYEELDPNAEISELDLNKELADIHLFIKIMTKKNVDSRISNGKLQSLVDKLDLLSATTDTDDKNKKGESSTSKRKLDNDIDESGGKRKFPRQRRVYGRKRKRS